MRTCKTAEPLHPMRNRLSRGATGATHLTPRNSLVIINVYSHLFLKSTIARLIFALLSAAPIQSHCYAPLSAAQGYAPLHDAKYRVATAMLARHI